MEDLGTPIRRSPAPEWAASPWRKHIKNDNSMSYATKNFMIAGLARTATTLHGADEGYRPYITQWLIDNEDQAETFAGKPRQAIIEQIMGDYLQGASPSPTSSDSSPDVGFQAPPPNHIQVNSSPESLSDAVSDAASWGYAQPADSGSDSPPPSPGIAIPVAGDDAVEDFDSTLANMLQQITGGVAGLESAVEGLEQAQPHLTYASGPGASSASGLTSPSASGLAQPAAQPMLNAMNQAVGASAPAAAQMPVPVLNAMNQAVGASAQMPVPMLNAMNQAVGAAAQAPAVAAQAQAQVAQVAQAARMIYANIISDPQALAQARAMGYDLMTTKGVARFQRYIQTRARALMLRKTPYRETRALRNTARPKRYFDLSKNSSRTVYE